MSSQDDLPAPVRTDTKQKEFDLPIISPTPGQLLAAGNQAVTPTPPDNLPADEDTKLKGEAESLAVTIAASAQSRQFFLQLEELGREELNAASGRIKFLDERINISSQRTQKLETGIPEAGMKMRQSLDRLHPQPASQSAVTRAISKIPLFGQQVADWWMESGMREWQLQRETIREQIDAEKDSLLANAESLKDDNVQLASMHDATSGLQMASLKKRAYTLELVIDALNRQLASIPAEQEMQRSRIQAAVERLTVKVMSLRRTEYRLQNGLVTVDVIIDGNMKTIDSLEMVAIETADYLPLAMSALQAQARQQRALQAKKAATEGMLDVMEKTVDMTDKGAREAAAAYYGTEEEDQRILGAHRKLLGTLSYLEQASRDGMVRSRQAIRRYIEMADELREKQDRLEAGHALSQEPEESK